MVKNNVTINCLIFFINISLSTYKVEIIIVIVIK